MGAENEQGKLDPNANHSVGMLAYHLVFWNETALARLHGEKPPVLATTTRHSMTSMRRTGTTSSSGLIA